MKLSEHTYGKSLSFSSVGVKEKMNFPNVIFYMRNLTSLPSTLTDFSLSLAGCLAWVVYMMTIAFLVYTLKLKRIVVMIISGDCCHKQVFMNSEKIYFFTRQEILV